MVPLRHGSISHAILVAFIPRLRKSSHIGRTLSFNRASLSGRVGRVTGAGGVAADTLELSAISCCEKINGNRRNQNRGLRRTRLELLCINWAATIERDVGE
jgi:hypothetical protein